MVQVIEQAQIITGQAAINPLQSVTQLALFDTDGTPFDFGDGGGETPGNATLSTPGLVKAASNPGHTAAVDVAGLVSDFNDLIDALLASGALSNPS